MLGHMLPEGQCSAPCFQNDTAEAHWLGIWDNAIRTLFFYNLSLTDYHFWKHEDNFLRKKHSVSK